MAGHLCPFLGGGLLRIQWLEPFSFAVGLQSADTIFLLNYLPIQNPQFIQTLYLQEFINVPQGIMCIPVKEN